MVTCLCLCVLLPGGSRKLSRGSLGSRREVKGRGWRLDPTRVWGDAGRLDGGGRTAGSRAGQAGGAAGALST